MDVPTRPNRKFLVHSSSQNEVRACDLLQSRLRHWQQVRSWARLIREVENLWHLEDKELRRLGAKELSQLYEEIPYALRARVNRWLDNYAVATRFKCGVTKLIKRT